VLRIVFSSPDLSVRGPAIFIDRDGVINCRRPDDYVLDFSQFVFIPGIRAALKQLGSLGLPLIVISNQAAVGKGLLDPVGLQEITDRMQKALREDGAALAAAYYCPHRPDENCSCRKPKPDLLICAADDFNVDLGRSVFIGDSESDVQAARAAGCKPILFGSHPRDFVETSASSGSLSVAALPSDLFDVAVKCLR